MSALKIWLWVSIDASSLTTFSTNRQWSSLSHVWNFHVPFDFLTGFTPYKAIQLLLGMESKIKRKIIRKQKF